MLVVAAAAAAAGGEEGCACDVLELACVNCAAAGTATQSLSWIVRNVLGCDPFLLSSSRLTM